MTNRKDFIQTFIAYDCRNRNDGFDEPSTAWYTPEETERILRRLRVFGCQVNCVDIAEDFGEVHRTRGSSWGVVAAFSPRSRGKDRFDEWIAFLGRETTQNCLLAPTYDVPDDVLALFPAPYENDQRQERAAAAVPGKGSVSDDAE